MQGLALLSVTCVPRTQRSGSWRSTPLLALPGARAAWPIPDADAPARPRGGTSTAGSAMNLVVLLSVDLSGCENMPRTRRDERRPPARRAAGEQRGADMTSTRAVNLQVQYWTLLSRRCYIRRPQDGRRAQLSFRAKRRILAEYGSPGGRVAS
ncbi:hypothetical protein OH77DRAFT_283603 [Trametes cingulata]|nr:hypothetical protein OH77DRAFT_283603 [Trametes cingulata]